MKPHWIIVADRVTARIYQEENPPHLVTEFVNLKGHARAQDLESDRQGRSYSASSPVTFFTQKTPAKRRVLEEFTNEISDYLGRHLDEFGELTIAAEPRLLGTLKSRLEKSAQKKVTKTLPKNLTGLTARELSEYIRNIRSPVISTEGTGS